MDFKILQPVLHWHSSEMFSRLTLTILFGLIALLRAERPNIVFIMADDLGWSDVGFHSGDVKTPNIDALAMHSIMFKRHYSQPLCSPSRAALLTGDYPIRHGMQGTPCIPGVADGLPLGLKIMPQYFSDLGYKTHLVGKWHLGYETKEHLPTRRGFDTFFGYLNGYLGYWDGIHYYNDRAGRDFRRGEKGAWREVYGRYLTEVLTEEAVKVIKDQNETDSFLLFVNHVAVHTTELSMEKEAPPDVTNHTGRGILRDMARWMDWSVGEIIAELDKKQILNNTIVVFISDNGAPTCCVHYANYGSNWPFRGQKVSTHEGGVRTVALVYSSMFQQVPRVTEQIFHITDWLPTLYSAAGGDVKMLQAQDGIDQWRSLTAVTEGPRKEFLVDIDENTQAEAYIMGRWKLLRNHHPKSSSAIADLYHGDNADWMGYDIESVRNSTAADVLGGIPENWEQLKTELKVELSCSDKKSSEVYDCHSKHCLFDLQADPSECRDLAAANATTMEIAKALVGRLDYFRGFLKRQVPKFYDSRANPTSFNDYWSPWLDSSEVNLLKRG